MREVRTQPLYSPSLYCFGNVEFKCFSWTSSSFLNKKDIQSNREVEVILIYRSNIFCNIYAHAFKDDLFQEYQYFPDCVHYWWSSTWTLSSPPLKNRDSLKNEDYLKMMRTLKVKMTSKLRWLQNYRWSKKWRWPQIMEMI